MVLWHYLSEFAKKIYQKMNIQNVFWCNLPVKTSQNFGTCTSENCNFYKKLVVWYIFTILSQKRASLVLAIYIFEKIYLKMKSLNILKYSLLQTNKLVIPYKNMEVKMVQYSQTSVFEHDSFWKAIQKPICSKTESYFSFTNNVKEINSFHVPKE